MADQQHLDVLKQGVEAWNIWRTKHSGRFPDLSKANLIGTKLRKASLYRVNLNETDLNEADLYGANLMGANLSKANLNKAILFGASLRSADLRGANLNGTDLTGANLSFALLEGANLSEANLGKAILHKTMLAKAILSKSNLKEADLSLAYLVNACLNEANLSGADLRWANLSGADLTGADLNTASLRYVSCINTNFEEANITGCRIYGISAWNLKLRGAKQSDLIITPDNEPTITVDNLEVAQFIYLLVNNEKIRHVIDTIVSKVVLILGRFTPERKTILDAIREELRKHDYIPIVFDFDKPSSRDTQETVTTLARLAKFIIADITDPKSIPQELVSIVETLPSVPVQPILKLGYEPWGMYDHIKRYPWVLEIYRYGDLDSLLLSLKDKVIAPAEMRISSKNGTFST